MFVPQIIFVLIFCQHMDTGRGSTVAEVGRRGGARRIRPRVGTMLASFRIYRMENSRPNPRGNEARAALMERRRKHVHYIQ